MASKLLLMLVLGTVAVTSIVGQRDIGLSGPEIRNLAIGQNPDLLARAALVGESVIIAIDSPEVIAPVQENVNANFWCLPWLQRFPGGSIRWLFQSFDTLTGELNCGKLLCQGIVCTCTTIKLNGNYSCTIYNLASYI